MVQLEANKLFSELSAEDVQFLRGVALVKSFRRGEEIFHEGDPGDGLYLVGEGAVEISVPVSQKDKRVFTRIPPGELFGEMAVFEGKPRSACALATEDTVVYFISTADFYRLVERCPKVAMAAVREISSRLRDFNNQFLREVLQAEQLAVVGRFARSIIHDLKNPLNIISMTSELNGMPGATPQSLEQGRLRIAKQVERINDMIGEILEFTQTSRPDVVLCPTDFARFFTLVLAEIEPEVKLKASVVHVPKPPPEVSSPFDPKRLRRVFQNLLHNATDAMPDGGRITIRFRVEERKEGKEIITDIEDTGPGIAPEIAGRLFEPFATYGKAHGTGLGLSICRKILEEHQGWIKVRNHPGGGAVFSFGLPVCG